MNKEDIERFQQLVNTVKSRHLNKDPNGNVGKDPARHNPENRIFDTGFLTCIDMINEEIRDLEKEIQKA